MSIWSTLFVMLVTVLSTVSTREVRLVNNGYENLNIFITDRVKEDPNLIKRIQDVFTNASALLFKATKNRAYFKNITIVIPKTWTQVDWDLSLPSVGTFGEHVRVDRGNRARGRAPFVRGNLECGKPGWFMHLSPDFLQIDGETPYGPHTNAIVHEWGHLRWGLFDEYPSVQDRTSTRPNRKIQFYNEGGKWIPVTCSKDVKGGAYRSNCNLSKPCNLNSITIPSACRFCADRDQTAKASLMSAQWIASLESFCERDSDASEAAVRHNSNAPNTQNQFCDGQSAWEVMEQHDDFKDGNNEAATFNTDTRPSFTIVKETGRVRVIVYDVSGSMDGSKIVQQKLASYVVIDNVVETGSWLGLVSFTSYASTLASLTEITNSNIRSNLKTFVPSIAGGRTNIASGLEEAIKVIKESNTPTDGTEILLISDGESEPYIHMIPSLQEKGITVHTISISQDADQNMAKLAAETGGNSYTYLETNSVSLVDVLSQVISTGTGDNDVVQKILGKKTAIDSANPFVDYFNIDDGLGNETIITVLHENSVHAITVNVTGPEGFTYTDTSSGEITTIQLGDNVKEGRYDFNISTTVSSQFVIEVTITTRPVSEDVEVLRVTSSFSNPTLDFDSPGEIQLYTSVEKAGSPVLNANVTAVLAGDSSYTPRELGMKDSGTGADLIANDGVYSVYLIKSYFASNRQSTRYNVKVVVTGDGGAFTYTSDVVGTGKAASVPGAIDEVDFTPVQLNDFQRQSIPGEITVLNAVINVIDTTPPAKIIDFRVESITNGSDVNKQTLVYAFVWTAVGDDMDVGTAQGYEMRMDKDSQYLRKNFNNSAAVPVNLTLPKPSGETERYSVNFTLTDCNGTCYLAARARDGNGLLGDISNVINIDIDFSYEPEEDYSDDDGDANEASSGLSNGVIIGIGSAFLVAIIVFLSVVYICRVRTEKHKAAKRHSKTEEHKTPNRHRNTEEHQAANRHRRTEKHTPAERPNLQSRRFWLDVKSEQPPRFDNLSVMRLPHVARY